MPRPLRVVLADDERPARKFLINLLKSFPDVDVVGEAGTGKEAIDLIEAERPDLALLDLQMPETTGLEVARVLKTGLTPSIAFVTAHDDFAIQAFELNAIDYLLKPVEKERLAHTIERARARAAGTPQYLERIPVKRKDETIILPVRQISSIVAEGELLHLTTVGNERFTISHRLHALEARLDPAKFVRLSRGSLAALDQIQKVSPLPGGTYQVQLANGETLPVSRIQSKLLRETLLRL